MQIQNLWRGRRDASIHIAPMPVGECGIFYETQSGGLCRLHALNAYFGRAAISPAEFERLSAEYDEYLLRRFNITVSCREFDLMNSDQTNLVSYVLKCNRVYARYYALNALYQKPVPAAFAAADFFFAYNAGHIWGVRRCAARHMAAPGGAHVAAPGGAHWHKVDSLGGVSRYDIGDVAAARDVGYLVPVPMKAEFAAQIGRIREIMRGAGVADTRGMAEYLRVLHERKEILGELELPLGAAVSLLETQMFKRAMPPEFARVDAVIKKYNEFLGKFTAGRYADIALILGVVPGLVMDLLTL